MKVTAADLRWVKGQIRLPEFLGDEVNDVVLDLKLATDPKKYGCFGDDFVLFKYIGPEDGVDETRFILERHKNDTLGRPGSLSTDHQPRVPNELTIVHAVNGLRVGEALFVERLTYGLERMAANTVRGTVVIPENLLVERQGVEIRASSRGNERQRSMI